MHNHDIQWSNTLLREHWSFSMVSLETENIYRDREVGGN